MEVRAPCTLMWMIRAAAPAAKASSRAALLPRSRAWQACAVLCSKDTLSDPFPLPFSKELDPKQRAEGVNLASERQGVEGMSVPIRVPNRENEPRPRLLARLQYQCRKRGTLETDLLLSTFAQSELASLPDEELHELDALLDEPDWDIFYWCTDRKPVPERWQASFTTQGRLGYRLRIHTRNDHGLVRRFPPLKGDIQSPSA